MHFRNSDRKNRHTVYLQELLQQCRHSRIVTNCLFKNFYFIQVQFPQRSNLLFGPKNYLFLKLPSFRRQRKWAQLFLNFKQTVAQDPSLCFFEIFRTHCGRFCLWQLDFLALDFYFMHSTLPVTKPSFREKYNLSFMIQRTIEKRLL